MKNKKEKSNKDFINTDELFKSIEEGIKRLKKNTQQLLEEDASILDKENVMQR